MHFKKYLLAGLLVWLPLAITVWVLIWLVGALDGVMSAVLTAIGIMVPTEQTGEVIETLRPLHGLGVVLVVGVLLLTGAMVSNVAGRWWVRQWDRLLSNIPIVKSIYTSIKKVSDTLFSSNGNAFRKALLVQFPLPGSWTIAFQTGSPAGEVAEHLGSDYISVYVPTTPNPTSGYFLVVRRSEVRELEMSVDQALTYVISMGAVAPDAAAGLATGSSATAGGPPSTPPSQH
jgi:uncharacterized membrane protein